MGNAWKTLCDKVISLGLFCTGLYFFIIYIFQYSTTYLQPTGQPWVNALLTAAVLLLLGGAVYVAGKQVLQWCGGVLQELQIAEWIAVAAVLIMAVLPRLVLMQVMQIELDSDFLTYFEYASRYAESGVFPVDRYIVAVCPNIVLFVCFLGEVFRLISVDLTVALVTNLTLFVLAALFFYGFLRRLVPQGYALLGSALFCMNPMFLYYSLVLSIEPFGLVFTMCGLYLYVLWDKSPEKESSVTGGTLLCALVSGVVLAIANYIRPNAMILLVAIAISVVLRPKKHRIILLLLTFGGYWLCGQSLNAFRDAMLGTTVSGINFGWTLFEGMDPTTYGVWNERNTAALFEVYANNPPQEVQGIMLQMALERASTFDLLTWVDMFLGKGGKLWASCGNFVEANIGTSVVALGYELFHLLEMVGYMVLVTVFTLPRNQQRVNTHLLVLYLLPVGMMILHSFATSIPRYRYIAMPFLYAVAMMILTQLPREKQTK